MKILIDGRFYGLENAGIGRYLMNLVKNLFLLDKKNEYVIFLKKNYYDTLILPENWKKILVDIPHYSFMEQIKIPGLIRQENPNLVFFPHFNVPIFYRGKFYVMIHDLIKHTSRGRDTTTKNPATYWLKYLAYKVIFKHAVKSSQKIFVPSQYVKNNLINEYRVSDNKITVTYEGVDEHFFTSRKEPQKENKYFITKPYIIYAGSLYPHKNVDKLVQSIILLNQSAKKKITLVLVCARNTFYKRMEEKIIDWRAENYIKMLGFVDDNDLSQLYQESAAMVFPTTSEGFGLPGLEAMASGTPVVCSDIPVLKEIYGNAALYFDPQSVTDIVEKIGIIMNNQKVKTDLIDKGSKQAKKYSWEKMAEQIINSYEM